MPARRGRGGGGEAEVTNISGLGFWLDICWFSWLFAWLLGCGLALWLSIDCVQCGVGAVVSTVISTVRGDPTDGRIW
jgi:hypothetical protein